MTRVLKDWDGLQQYLSDLEEQVALKAPRPIVEGGADIALGWMKKDMRSGKSGRKYANLPNQSSAAGESPAVQSGKLISSLERTLELDVRGHAAATVSSDDDKAALLEYGTSQMSPRPFMRPSIDKNKKEIEKLASKEITKVIRNA